MATGSVSRTKIVGEALVVVVALLVVGAAEGQILPTPCCRIDCCDGRPECCDAGPWMAPAAAAATAPPPADARARPAGAAREVGGGN
ncbi:hypothetical protein GQ55_1G274300 [Panicum hallii var. hallii]|jgi:hypothetical protein|uniref:Granulins domain-containing protein n=2 Tax=Panicum hallii TaxID=206008 RepID=A0A2T7F855_9POAL|nr:hypothetical protein PAHAL_1G279400 [Panicum hallii]PUZ76252.1 hypothetical protein GQ55_1G274300 [Panicum hallii var. hallii]